MSVLRGPHCGSIVIITDGNPETGLCPKLGCGCVLEKLDEPEAGNAMRDAFYGYDHGFTPAAERGVEKFNEGIARIVKALETP